MLKALLLRQEQETIAKTQNGKGRPGSQPELLAKLLRNRSTGPFTDLGRRQVFDSAIVNSHVRRKIHPTSGPFPSAILVV